MADRRRIVTISDSGTVTTVLDVDDAVNYVAERESFNVVPGAPQPIQAARNRRFGGSRKVGETHDNGSIGWNAFVKGATADAAVLNLDSLFAILRAPRQDLFFEWRPDGATASTFFEIRGPANMTPTYRWAMFAQAKYWQTTVEIPVSPIARGLPSTVSLGTPTLPAVVSLGTVGGSAPAFANVQLRTGAGSGSAPVWGLIGWYKTTGTPQVGSVAPAGVIEAETGTLVSGFADTGVDATFRGSHGITVTTSGAGTAQALFPVDPSVLDVDDFALSDVDIEVWARIKIASTVVSPKLTLQLQSSFGTGFMANQYTPEWGSAGKLLVLPSSGTQFRVTRLGTLSMPVDRVSPIIWHVRVDASWAAGSTGQFAIDYLVMVPSRARALSPSSKPLDATFPKFIATNSDTMKIIRGDDLSGRVAFLGGILQRDSGLGGSPIELPTGTVNMLLWLSSTVPDDPTVDTQSNQLAHTLTNTSQVTVIPRYYLAKGA